MSKQNEEKKKAAGSNAVTKGFVEQIKAWIKAEMERDPLLAEVVKSKPQKTVEGACNYVLKVARESRQEGWSDDEVYGMIRHFYDEDNLTDPGNQHPSRIVTNAHVDLSERDRAEAMEQAKKEYKHELEVKAAKAELERKEKEKRQAEERLRRQQEKAEKARKMQLTLFD